MNGLGNNANIPRSYKTAHVRPNRALRNVQSLIDAALKELNNAYMFDTKANLISQYEVYEDLAFASRRKALIPIYVESYCMQYPDALKCRVYDL